MTSKVESRKKRWLAVINKIGISISHAEYTHSTNSNYIPFNDTEYNWADRRFVNMRCSLVQSPTIQETKMTVKTIQQLKLEAASTLQKYFPNGGGDWNLITTVIHAIAENKIPNVMLCADVNDAAENGCGNSSETFASVVEPVMNWLSKNVHPHHSVIITATDAELVEAKECHSTSAFLVD